VHHGNRTQGIFYDHNDILIALETALHRIKTNGSNVLVVSAGLDPHEGDPFEAFKVTTPDFARIGTAITALGLPTLRVQEGGYLRPALGDNLTSFLHGVQGK